MDFSLVFVVISLVFIVSLYKALSSKRPKNFPPGPKGIPILGNALQMGKESYKVALELSEKYGDIIGLKLGSHWAVVLNDTDDIRDAFNRPEFSGRKLYNHLMEENCGEGTAGVIMSEGKTWVDQRRFCLKTLRDFGFGKKSMESIIMEEVTDLIEEFKRNKEQPIKTSHIFNVSVFNVIWSIVAGERYPRDHPQLAELMKILLELFATFNEGIRPFYMLFPALVNLRIKFPFLFPEAKLFTNKAFTFLRKPIQQHKNTIEDGNPRDFIDTFLDQVRQTSDPNSSFYPKNVEDFELISLLLDIFVAGAETTSTTMTWAFFLLAMHKDKQQKFYDEIQTVVGNRQVSFDDKPSLPYVEATMLEILRLSTIAPVAIPHTVTQDVVFKNYFIPKDSLVISNIYAAHYRKSVWGDPENFRPERFLSNDGKTVVKNKNLIPFGVGKRVCAGESLARDEFFLFLTNLVQTFEIGMPEDEPKHTLKLTQGAVLTPEPHKIVLKERDA